MIHSSRQEVSHLFLVKSRIIFAIPKKKFEARTMPTLRPAPPVAESVS
jgi:hypothetical protein